MNPTTTQDPDTQTFCNDCTRAMTPDDAGEWITCPATAYACIECCPCCGSGLFFEFGGRVFPAREAGRAMMEAAGVDVEALERSRVGRPSLSPGAKPGATSPMWHLRAPEDLNAAARARAEAEGRDLSSLVRDAVKAYLAAS